MNPTTRVLIIGAGYTGLQVARHARQAGLEVTGTTRDDDTVEALKAIDATALRWDVLDGDPTRLADHLGPGTATVYSIPTLYREWEPAPAGEVARHVRPVDRVLRVVEETGARRFVYLSSTSVYGDHGGEWIDEDAPRRPVSPYGRMRRDIEDHVLGFDGSIDAYVCRIVGIYGPGRTLERLIRSGRYPLVDGGRKRTNRIHVDDLARIILAVATRAEDHRRAFIASDGDPRPVAELVDWCVANLGVERPEEVSLEAYARTHGPNSVARWASEAKLSNRRVTEELGVALQHPDVIAGYRAIFGVPEPPSRQE